MNTLQNYRSDAGALAERYARPVPQGIAWAALGVFGVSLVVLCSVAPTQLSSADAAVYQQQIERGDLLSRPTHVGYYGLGAAFFRVAGASDRSLNQLSAVAAALTLGLLFWMAYRLARALPAAGAATAVLATHGLFVLNALHAEVYLVESALLLGALHLHLAGAPLRAGLALAAAALVTPSAIFVAPAFVLVRPRLRDTLWIAATSAIALVVVLAPFAQHYLFGSRGLLSGAAADVDPVRAVRKEGMEVVLGFFGTWSFVALGILLAKGRRWLRPLVLASGLGWALNFALGERFGDVPVQLPLYVWLVLFAGLVLTDENDEPAGGRLAFLSTASAAAAAAAFWGHEEIQVLRDVSVAFLGGCVVAFLVGPWLAERVRPGRGVWVLLGLTLAAGGALAWMQEKFVRDEAAAFHEAVAAQPARAGEPLAVGGWSPGILFEHRRYDDSYTGNWVDVRELEEEQTREARAAVEGARAAGREVWLLDEEAQALPLSDLGLDGWTAMRRGPVVVLSPPPAGSSSAR